ncbi:hypothetical protein GQ457_04G030280 [Hibiscus cannabinus]
MAERDGVGLNMMMMPISFVLMPVFLISELSAPNMTASASARASSMHRLGGLDVIPQGKYVPSPKPDRVDILL